MPRDRLTLWKLQVLVAGFALIFALLYWLLGPTGGFIMMIIMLPLWSVAAWPFLSERQTNLVLNFVGASFFLFILLCGADAFCRAALGFGLPLRDKGLLTLAWLYCIAGLSVGHSAAKLLRDWGS